MSENTKIEWTDHSWSPWRGCTKVSPGCANCYAESLSQRFNRKDSATPTWGGWGKGVPRVPAKNWGDPVRWDEEASKDLRCSTCGATRFDDGVNADGFCSQCETEAFGHRQTVFPSLCDWLDEEVPIEWLARFLELIHDTPNLTWLLLTKRPENWRKRISAAISHSEDATAEWLEEWTDCIDIPERGAFPVNVWVGASAENQSFADQRMQHLLRIPAVGRFLSIEPMLGPVDYLRSLVVSPNTKSGDIVSQLIHWVIVGGESGPGARPCNVEWVRSIVNQCAGASVPCFVKQLGALVSGQINHQDNEGHGVVAARLSHPKGGDPAEWPEDLRVRQFPEGLR